ncbi:unnamed protein product, partial [Adineta steineri]
MIKTHRTLISQAISLITFDCFLFHIAPASFSQALLCHNESIHFTPCISQVPIYNMPFVYSLYSHHALSVKHLRHALELIVTKHQSLRTSLISHTHNNRLMQQIIDFNQNNNTLFTFIESSYATHEQLNHIIHEEKYNPQLFDVALGRGFRCRLVYYKQISSNHLLSHKDLLIFNFHHALFDYPSMNIFLHDLNQAYTTHRLPNNDDIILRYLDYAVIEQQIPMTGASMFWLDVLHDCKLDQSLSLPFDRYRLSNEHRSGRGTSISFDFSQDLSHQFLSHASANNISLEHLTFAFYFIFLFKLTNGQTDLCVAMNINNNRYRDELKSIIGLFENVIPLRCQLDPHWCFHQLLEFVQEITTNSMKYSYFPLQRILNQHPHVSKHAFLDTSLEFISFKNSNTLMIGDSEIVPASFSFNNNEDGISSVSDYSVSFHHDMNMNQLSCTINASLDLFNRETAEKISQRFHSMLHELSTSMVDNQMNKPIHELSLTLSNEQYLMQSLNNTQMSFPSSPFTCIHHEFVYQVMKHPQKLAVELDEQSLTYCELLHYAQVLSLALLNDYQVLPGDIVCQCVERSLSMVIGIMGIEMAGGVYCPLSPRDPQHRLYALIQQTECRLVLAHYQTKTKFNDNISSFIIDLILVNQNREYIVDIDRLSDIIITSEHIAYVVFTSGSTGIPKGVQIRHRNLMACINSLVSINLFSNKDTMIQMANCSYDVHVQEVIGALSVGATIIMLHPEGNMDIEYVINVLNKKGISYLQSVPAYVNNMLDYVEKNNASNLSTLRTLDIGGEKSTYQLIEKIHAYVPSSTAVWNSYGPAETTVNCTCHVIDKRVDIIDIPVGHSLPNYRCLVLDSLLQSVIINQEGELFVGEMGVFAGYIRHDDLSAKALVEIDGQLYYRTGDLVTMDNNGLLHYQGRKDHQIKLHGQRIELGEIERCLLNITSISAGVVMKWNDDYLVAYVQSFSHINEEQLRQHCQSHLPPHMIPSIFIILDKLPLNQNGKIDRKLLPPPDFSLSTDNIDGNVTHTTLEKQLQDIFSEAFHIESPRIEISFGQLGGTSLGAIRALTLIRQQLCTNIDIGLLFANPSIRQLAQAIEPLMILDAPKETVLTTNQSHETHVRFSPSFVIESVGIALLVCQWFLPIMVIHRWCPFLFPVLPVFHLLFYAICSHLLLPRNINDDNVFSWSFYRWWFLDRLWNNNTFWLQHILGTPLYNYYLRLCGARISLNTHIYTTIIDAPWLLEMDDGSWIANETYLNCLYFNDDDTFKLSPIRIGSNCSIGTRSILFDGVDMQNNIIVQPMSSVTGFVASETIVDGPCAAGEIYPIASRLYLQKIWLRQLIVSSFHHAWLLPTGYDYLYPYVLRWLGAHVEENVKLAGIDTFLSCPTNLLKLEMGVTTFGGVLIVPTELTLTGDHRVDQIVLGFHTNLGNGCSIMPGSYLESETMIGNLTRISRETKSKCGEVFMGVPARTMPFQMPPRLEIQDQIEIIPFWHTCLSHYVSKCLLLSIYSFGGLVGGSVIHTILACSFCRCCSYIRYQVIEQIITRMILDYAQLICSFLGNTQWLIRLFRAYGAHIGENVIMSDISNITDYHLMTIGDNVRLHVGTQIQGHSFEQRIFKLAPVSIGNSCVLMSYSIVMPGCKLMGNNRLYPLTLIMKNDQLPPDTHWKGVPA